MTVVIVPYELFARYLKKIMHISEWNICYDTTAIPANLFRSDWRDCWNGRWQFWRLIKTHYIFQSVGTLVHNEYSSSKEQRPDMLDYFARDWSGLLISWLTYTKSISCHNKHVWFVVIFICALRKWPRLESCLRRRRIKQWRSGCDINLLIDSLILHQNHT